MIHQSCMITAKNVAYVTLLTLRSRNGKMLLNEWKTTTSQSNNITAFLFSRCSLS